MVKRWNYSGDMNLTYGGLFWRIEDGYVDAVEVNACSDSGGPDNKFEIVDGTIYMPVDKYKSALSCCGYTLDDTGNIVDCCGGVHKKGSKAFWTLLVDAFRVYHGVERNCMNGAEIVQIGKEVDPFYNDRRGDCWNPEPDTILRANASLKNYVRRNFLR